MATRAKGGPTTNRNVDPAKVGTYHVADEEQTRDNPQHRDKVIKDLTGKLLVEFVDHDDGFLKVRRALDSADLHLTWTWSVGRLAGRYVYVRVFAWQTAYGLELLMQKVAECEAGLRPATIDKLGHR